MSNVFLSIITINLNNRVGLRNTIESVLIQKSQNFEYIIIDGGSKDGSIEEIKKHSDKVKYWISEPDSGLYAAMNKGIPHATGKYLYFLNSGDTFFDEHSVSSLFTSNPKADIIICNIFYKYKDKNVLYLGEKNHDLLSIYNGFIHHQASIVKKDCFTKYGSFDERFKIKGDYELYFRFIVKNNCSYEYFPVNLAYFDAYGISNNKDNSILDEKEVRIAHENNLPIYVVHFLDRQSRMQKPEYYFLIRMLDKSIMLRSVLRIIFNSLSFIYKKVFL